jgi:hypothetical protein
MPSMQSLNHHPSGNKPNKRNKNPMAGPAVHRSNTTVEQVGNRRVDRTPTEQREAGVDRAKLRDDISHLPCGSSFNGQRTSAQRSLSNFSGRDVPKKHPLLRPSPSLPSLPSVFSSVSSHLDPALPSCVRHDSSSRMLKVVPVIWC